MPENRDAPSHEPDDYAETVHFAVDVSVDDGRFIDREMVDETIRDGRDFPNSGGDGNVERRKTFDGVDCVLIIDLDGPRVVTGWNEVRSWSTARSSDRWSLDDLVTIANEQEAHG